MPNSDSKHRQVINDDDCRREASRHPGMTADELRLNQCCDWINGHEKFHEEKLDPRVTRLEHGQIWVIGAAAGVSALLGALFALFTSGIIKWN